MRYSTAIERKSMSGNDADAGMACMLSSWTIYCSGVHGIMTAKVQQHNKEAEAHEKSTCLRKTNHWPERRRAEAFRKRNLQDT